MSVYFNYTVSGPNSVHLEVNDHGNHLSAVYVNTNTVIDLTEEMLTEWDMLTDSQREDLATLAGQILDISNE